MSRIDQPVIILGPPRSGTTILGSLLSCHSQFGYFEEPRSVWRWGNEKHSDMLRAEHATSRVQTYIRGYFESQLSSMGKSRLLEKTPQNCLRCEFVDEVFPDAKYIFIYRDSIDTIASILDFWNQHTHGVASIGSKKLLSKLRQTRPSQLIPYTREFIKRVLPKRSDGIPSVMWGPRLPGLNEMVRDMSLARVAATQWRACMEGTANFLHAIPQDRYMTLKLEDMDASSFDAILSFLGLESEPAITEAVSARFSYGDVRRQRDLSQVFLNEVQPLVEPTELYLKQLGFLKSDI